MRSKCFLRDRRGSIAIVFAVSAVPLIGLAALGTEAGMWYVTKRQAQNAADASALAGAMTWGASTNGAWSNQHALNVAKANGYDIVAPAGVTSQTVSVTKAGDLVTASITQTRPALLASVMGLSNITINAVAVAGVNKTSNDVCFLALNNSNSNPAVDMVGSSSFADADPRPGKGCSVMSNGSMKLASPPSLTNVQLLANQGCSSASACAGGTNYNVPKAYNPLAVLDGANSGLPAISGGGRNPSSGPQTCTGSGSTRTCTTTLSPGTYNALSINNNDTYILTAGTYFFDSINMNGGTLTSCTSPTACATVNIVVNTGFSATGTSAVNLTANANNTTYPNLNGVLIYDRNTSPHTDKFTGSGTSLYAGALYLPYAAAVWGGNSASTTLKCTEVIADTLKVNGGAVTNVDTSQCPSTAVPKEQLVWLTQ